MSLKRSALAALLALACAGALGAEDYDVQGATVQALPESASAPAAPALSTGFNQPLGPALYVLASGGVRFASNQASDSYFRFSQDGLPPTLAELDVLPTGGAALGCQLTDNFGLELGADYAHLGFSSTQAQGSWNAYDAYVMPLLRFRFSGAAGAQLRMQAFGVRVGKVLLEGASSPLVQAVPIYPGPPLSQDSGSADESGQAMDLGFVYRYEAMEGERLDLGVELDYDYVYIPTLDAHPGTVANAQGSPLRLNLSGVSLKLVLAAWLLKPGPRP